MSVYKRGTKGTHWHYYFRVRGVRYRGGIPEARTKQQAEQAEFKLKREVFEERFGIEQKGTDLLSDFLDDVYLPWSKVNKKSWRDDAYMLPMLKAHFEGRALRDISVQLVERFKADRMNTPTKKGTTRQPATVNRELTLLSSAFSLAVRYDKADFNPCNRVDLFPLDNFRYRYLLPDEESSLMAALNGPRAHLKSVVVVALGTGMRLGEQLQMKRSQVDFLRNMVTARKTKNGRPRDIPMNDEVREALVELCKGKRPDDYVFVSPKDSKKRLREVKKGFHTACRLAGVEGLIWKDLRATFGTRLADVGCDAFTIAQLLGHSDVRVTMRYVRSIEDRKRVAVEAIKLSFQRVSTNWPQTAQNDLRPPVPAAVND
jgi:integrase